MRRPVLLCAFALGSACATTYNTRGLVLRVDPATSTVTVSHEAVPGYMGAMVMPFAVKDAKELRDVQPGDVIAFRLRPKSSGTRIDRLEHLSATGVDSGLTMTPSTTALVKVGEAVPDFTLINQHGDSVSLSSVRGSVVAVTFI
ncbi:MAG: copper-binding protein, partial [Vicinamibacteria bacterium]|nr:copper-binding protein [Vicinamibacteria bacterium]